MAYAEDIAALDQPPRPEGAPVVVVGGGPVGMRAAQLLLGAGVEVLVLNAESHLPYNRVRLTPLLCGDVQFRDIALPGATDGGAEIPVLSGQRVAAIDRERRHVVTRDGAIWPYSKLVIATGSSAFTPSIPGKTLPGVYVFRTADDASALLARSFSAQNVAVIGGGLLGLEAARGMKQRGCAVTVIEHEDRLMPRQLDPEASRVLEERITAMDVAVRTGSAVREIGGQDRVERLVFADGAELACDTVIICTGVHANLELARQADLPFGRGIIVDDQMRTSDPDIFAVGECAQHEERMYGLVGPGYAQAEVAARVIAGGAAAFAASPAATKLKVVGADVFSVGEVDRLQGDASIRRHVWRGEGAYRSLYVRGAKLAAANAVGAWEQAGRVQDAVQSGATVYPWMTHRFRRTGSIWLERDDDVAALPDAATICNCTGVTCGRIRAALDAGCGDAEAISARTGAGTVCGTCRPVLDELASAGGPPKPVAYHRPLLALSLLAALAALLPILLGAVPLPQSFDAESLRVWLWRDNIVKQWSGLVLVGITVAAAAIGLRKRLRVTDRLGAYDIWRLAHIAIGLLALGGFFAHTGFRLGENLNLALGICFAATLAFGAISGLATGGEHKLRERRIGTARKPARRWPTWVHIFAVWPLPALIAIHVLAAYAY